MSSLPRPKRPYRRPQPQQYTLSLLRRAVNREHELVTAFCCQPGDENEVVRNYKRRTVTISSAHRLQTGKWLNDELFQYFTEMVSNNDKLLSSAEPSRKRSRIFNTFFYTKLISASGSYSYEAVAGWTRTLDIFELDKILIPINVDNQHWIVVMVSMTKKLIQLYDPMGGHNSDPEPYFHQILRFLSDEHLDKKGGAVLPEFSSWRLVLQDTQLPMQPNAYDCGVFVSAFIYFSVLNLPFHRDSGIDPNRFAADLRFQFARSIMTKIIHF